MEVIAVFTLAWPQSLTQLTFYAPILVLLGAVGHLENGAVLVGAAGTAAGARSAATRATRATRVVMGSAGDAARARAAGQESMRVVTTRAQQRVHRCA